MGNYLARFLGGLGPAMAPGYPVKSKYLMIRDRCDIKNLSLTQLQYFDENFIIPPTLYVV
jgi:hypothetical protein